MNRVTTTRAWKYTIAGITSFLSVLIVFGRESAALGQYDLELPPIAYSTTPVDDAVFRLAKNLTAGTTSLAWDEKLGWLPDLLAKLNISPETQTLVFSKTSLQIRHISPTNPRALYFSDDIYLGWVPGGEVIELSAVDSQQGPIFYLLNQAKVERPEIRRDASQCLTCHATSRTQNVPGYLVRSVFPGLDGHPLFGLGTITTDHTTPLNQRFGGWYVTGEHGSMRHRANVIAGDDPQHPIDPEEGANLQSVPTRAQPDRYLRDTSDIVALMVLEHQSQMHNLITRANYETRQAIAYQETMNRALDRASEYQSDSTARRIATAGEQLVRYLLFAGEFELSNSVSGNSNFAAEFSTLGPHDSQGRSLRQFDLRRRLFRYPCSYLIYSEAFDMLPPTVLEYVRTRVTEILEGREEGKEFAHLSQQDRQAIAEILRETKPGFLLQSTPVNRP